MKADEAKKAAMHNRVDLSTAQLKHVRETIGESVKRGKLYCVIEVMNGELLPGAQDTLRSDGYAVERDTGCWSKARYFVKWE